MPRDAVQHASSRRSPDRVDGDGDGDGDGDDDGDGDGGAMKVEAAGEHDLAGLLAGGSEASVSEEPPHGDAAKAVKSEKRAASPASRGRGERGASHAAPKREKSWHKNSTELRDKQDTSGVPCSVCNTPGHVGSHCPLKEAERLENDKRVLEQRAAAAREATAAKAADPDKKGSPPADDGAAARARERERERSRERARERERERERARSRDRQRVRSRERDRARSRDRQPARSREREPARDKPAAGQASKRREPERAEGARRERSASRGRDEKRRRSAQPRSRSPPRAPAEEKKAVEEKKATVDGPRGTLEGVMAQAKQAKRQADAVKTHDAPREMLRAVLLYLEAATMQESKLRASASDAAGEQLAVLLVQTSALCEFAGVRATELLRAGQKDANVTAALCMVRLLALRLCVCCVAQAAFFRRAALRAEAEAAAETADSGANAVTQKRMAVALLDAIKLSDLWERAGAAAIEATANCNVNRICTEALSSCMTVASAYGGYGELRQVRVHAKHAMAGLDRFSASSS